MIFEDGAITIFSSDRKQTFDVVKKRGTRKSKREICNNVFENLKSFTKDQFWIEFLEKAKYGNLPKNFKFFDGYLTYKFKVKTQTINLQGDLNYKTFQDFKEFIFDNSGIESPIDNLDRLKNTTTEVEKPYTFNKIKTVQSLIRPALCNYIDKFVKKYNFNPDDVHIFEAALYNRIICEQITLLDVTLKDNLIEDIRGVYFDENKREIIFESKPIHFENSDYEEITQTTNTSNSTDYIRDTVKKNKNTTIAEEWDNYIYRLLTGKKKRSS
jgi:hypothetical protein